MTFRTKVIKRILIACCLVYLFVGILYFLGFNYEEYDGYSIDELRIKKIFVLLWMIVIPFSVMIAVLISNKLFTTIILSFREFLFFIDYIIFRNVDSYTKYKTIKLLLNLFVIVLLMFWLKNIINTYVLVLFMLISEKDTIEEILKAIFRLLKGNFYGGLYVLLLISMLFVQILPVLCFSKKSAKE